MSQLPTFLTALEVSARLRCSERSVWRWASQGILPAPVQIGPNKRLWVESEITDYIARKLAEKSQR